MKRMLFPLLVASLLFSFSTQAQNRKAANFKLPTENGSTIELAQLKGKVVLVNFWATWCGPCLREIPDFIEVYEQYKSRGFEIVGIALDEEGFDLVGPFVKKYKIPYPVVIGTGKTVDSYGGFDAIPTSFLVNRDGLIVGVYTGLLSKARLEKKLKEIL